MRNMTIKQALEATTTLMKAKASPNVIFQILLSDGFDKRRAEIILRWSILAAIRE